MTSVRGSVAFRRTRLLAGFVAALLLAACGERQPDPQDATRATPPAAVAPDRPNLLLVTLDTTRADALSAYGQPLETTPNIDRLAERGVLFEDVSTSHPETLPSHATIFTGKWPFAHGVRGNAGYLLSDRNRTLAEVLRDNGYRTGAEIAALVLREDTRVTQGFEHYRGAESPGVTLKTVRYRRGPEEEKTAPIRVGSDVTARGIDFLREHRDEPFFLWLHYFDAHAPYSAPPLFNRRIPESPYHAEVAYADYQLGLVLRELERLGLADRTLVVVTADHGEGLEEHGEPTHSFFLYDSTVRVPLVLAGLPELPRGLRVETPVRTADVAPTILALLDLPALDGVQGRSLVPLLQPDAAVPELVAYGEASYFTPTLGLPMLRYLRRGPWKYIHKVNPELYDLQADPDEQHDLAGRHPERVADLRDELERLLAQAPRIDTEQEAVDEHTAAQLVALGYVARTPAFEIGDELESLELRGEDPVSKLEDVRVLSEVTGLLDRGQYQDALDALGPVRARNPDASYPLDLTAQALMGLSRHAEAVPLMERVRDARPGDPDPVYLLARALAGAGRGEEAAELLDGLLAEDPCDERVRLDQNQLLVDLGRYQARMAFLARGAELCPQLLANRNNWAWALATAPVDELRDGERAVRVIRQVIADADEPNPAYLDTLAAALAETGDFAGAIEQQAEAIEQLRALNGPPALISQLESQLAGYRRGEPVRDPPAGS